MLKKYGIDEPLDVYLIGHTRAEFYDVNFDDDSHSIINIASLAETLRIS